MLADAASACASYGLSLRPGETKILTNVRARKGVAGDSHVMVNGMHIELLTRDSATKYLSRKICFQYSQNVELDNRMRCAWRKFFVFKDELTNAIVLLRSRLQLFGSAVTPRALYGAACWKLTADMGRRLLKNQRQMLRLVVGSGGWRITHDRDNSTSCSSDGEDKEEVFETWVEWIQRTAQDIEHRLEDAGITDWIAQYRARKWKLAGKLLSSDTHKWSYKVLMWSPGRAQSKRDRIGRPARRWADGFADTCGHDWTSAAWNSKEWAELESRFTSH
ncbi:unnamed protein product [Prorocentrum cordatum]|uniref:Uncharacterized protein n=1 Tax=Prorocentrum cordatum TaxID=2364126 RepID=A0ABN9RSE6_9DINO|nr:unnamed protein product [Polarella glacialis]